MERQNNSNDHGNGVPSHFRPLTPEERDAIGRTPNFFWPFTLLSSLTLAAALYFTGESAGVFRDFLEDYRTPVQPVNVEKRIDERTAPVPVKKLDNLKTSGTSGKTSYNNFKFNNYNC